MEVFKRRNAVILIVTNEVAERIIKLILYVKNDILLSYDTAEIELILELF